MLRDTKSHPFNNGLARSLAIGRTAFYHQFPKERTRKFRGCHQGTGLLQQPTADCFGQCLLCSSPTVRLTLDILKCPVLEYASSTDEFTGTAGLFIVPIFMTPVVCIMTES